MLNITDVHSLLLIDLKLTAVMGNKPGFNFCSNISVKHIIMLYCKIEKL